MKAKVNTTADCDPYAGGPVYCLGNRSNVWGLFCPRIPASIIKDYFPDEIRCYLDDKGGGSEKAFELMTNKSHKLTNLYPKGVNTKEETGVSGDLEEAIKNFYGYTATDFPTVSLAPIAAQFSSAGLYHFP